MTRKMLFTTLVLSVTLMTYVEQSYAACNATINGYPMPSQLCAQATEIYGYVGPGDYWLDQQGNWGRVGTPYPQGNLYRDAQRRLWDGVPNSRPGGQPQLPHEPKIIRSRKGGSVIIGE